MRVGIVEDDDGMRESLEALLAVSAFEVSSFVSAESFLTSAASAHLEALVLDQNLPGMSGTDLLRFLSAQGQLPPAILISAQMNDKLRQEAKVCGAAEAMEKPISPRMLVSCLRGFDRQ